MARRGLRTRAERLAARREKRREQFHRPFEFVAAAVLSVIAVVESRTPAGGRRAERLAARRARTQRSLRRTSSVAVVGFIVFGATAAFGFWSVTGGSGAATAKSTNLQPVTFTATGTPSSLLLPGGSGDVSMSITNTNAFALKVTSIQQNGPVTVSGNAGCTSDGELWPSGLGNSGVSVPSQAVTGIIVAPGTNPLSIPGVARMAITSNTNCQGAMFSIPVSIAVQTP